MRKTLLWTAVTAAVSIGSVFANLAATPFPDIKTFSLIYEARVERFPGGAKNVKVWVPLAPTRDGQKIISRKITPEPAKVTKDPVHGNEIAYYEFPVDPGPFDVKVEYQVEMNRDEFEKSRAADFAGNAGFYMKPTTLMKVTPEIRRRAEDAVRGKTTVRDKALGIYESVIGHMTYDKETPGWGKGDSIRACELGKGNCTDFHSLFISMAQAAGISARFKIGFTVPDGQGEIKGYHCWAEFYEEGKGWQPVDASEAWKNREMKDAYFGNFDPNKFFLSIGRDIELEPRATSGPMNIFFYPHIEVDGRQFDDKIHTAFYFETRKQS